MNRFTNDLLFDLVAEGHAALAAPPIERVSAALTVLPKLVAELDHLCLYQHDVRQVRNELTIAVRTLREEVWTAQRQHPEVTYRAAHIDTALKRLNELLDRLDRLLHTDSKD